MTRIAVISDSHGGKLHLERFAELCRKEKFDQVCHLGDVVDDALWLRRQLDELQIPVALVAGNCDFYSREAREASFTIAGKRLLLVHGDKYGVKYGYDRLSYYAEERSADIALFGHTHQPFAGYVGGRLLVNPGALKNGSMCILEIDGGDVLPRMIDIDKLD